MENQKDSCTSYPVHEVAPKTISFRPFFELVYEGLGIKSLKRKEIVNVYIEHDIVNCLHRVRGIECA